VTIGIGFVIWCALVGNDLARIRSHKPDRPQLTRNVILSFLTLGIWAIYTDYWWARYLNEEKEEAGFHTDEWFPCMIVLYDLFSFSLLSTAVLQLELNKIAGGTEAKERGLE
jgi:hypothetical protein